MDEMENRNVPEMANVVDLDDQVAQLRHLVISALVLLIIISGTLNIFFLRQYRTVKGEFKVMEPQARAYIEDYQKNHAAATDEFIRKLSVYSTTHKDFEPIAVKYGLKPASGTAPAPSAGSNAPKK